MVILAVFALLGWFIDHIMLGLLLAALGYIAVHLLQLYRLEHWLHDGKLSQRPKANGIWGEVYQQIFRLKRRNRKRKRKLAQLLRQFQDAAAAVPDAVMVLTRAGEVVWGNGASQRLLGLRLPQDIGQPIVNLVRHPAFVKYLAGRRHNDSVIFPSPVDDALSLSARIIPYGQDQHLLLATDISRLQRLEQMRQDFVSNASHELRSPLTVISGYLETFLDSPDPCAEKWQQPLRGMHQQANRMLHIIEDLLMLSRLETQSDQQLKATPVAIPAMLDTILEDALALSGDRGHQIRVEANPHLWIRGSAQELRSAFSNLVFNAVRYTPDHGHIVIRWFADNHGVHLEVEDNGDGIAPHHIPRLTERFYRVDRGRQRERGGTGLGLAIVKHVVNRHQGQLRISSRLGAGSTFSCDFPLSLRLDKSSASTVNKAIEQSCPDGSI